MSKKQWYKALWDKEVFKEGIQAWHGSLFPEDNPFNLQEETIDHAIWLLGWTYASLNN